MHDPLKTPSRLLSFLVSLLRATGNFRGRYRLLAMLGRLAGGRRARVRIGPYCLGFDLGDFHQAEMALGNYDRDTADLIERILRPGDTYVDVGAQLGYFAALAGSILGPEGTMSLFEPDPRAHALLVEHMATADPSRVPRTMIFRQACSDARSHEKLYILPTLGRSTLTRFSSEAEREEPVVVELKPLDNCFEEQGLKHVRLVKMDIEGHEVEALRGLSRSLEARSVDFLIVERNPFFTASTGYGGEHLHALLSASGYLGAHEDGRPVTLESLGDVKLENLVYSRSSDLMRELFKAYSSEGHEEEARDEALRHWREEAAARDHPEVESRRIIHRAREGEIEPAIDAARRLLARSPGLGDLRGHLAYWFSVVGRIDEARAEYRRIVADDPSNEEARGLLAELDAGNPE